MKRTPRRNASLLLATFLLPLVVACGSPQEREKTYPVSGQVLLDGKPLPTGEIYFRKTETGSLNIVPVKDGRFSGRAPSGKRRVEINSFREEITPEARAMYGDSASPSRVNTIPEKFNLKSTVVADIAANASNEFTFEVFSK